MATESSWKLGLGDEEQLGKAAPANNTCVFLWGKKNKMSKEGSTKAISALSIKKKEGNKKENMLETHGWRVAQKTLVS